MLFYLFAHNSQTELRKNLRVSTEFPCCVVLIHMPITLTINSVLKVCFPKIWVLPETVKIIDIAASPHQSPPPSLMKRGTKVKLQFFFYYRIQNSTCYPLGNVSQNSNWVMRKCVCYCFTSGGAILKWWVRKKNSVTKVIHYSTEVSSKLQSVLP